MNQSTNYIYLPLQPTDPPAWLFLSLSLSLLETTGSRSLGFGEKSRLVFFFAPESPSVFLNGGEGDLGSFMHGQFLPFSVFILV